MIQISLTFSLTLFSVKVLLKIFRTINKLDIKTRSLQKPTNYAILFQEKLEIDLQREKEEAAKRNEGKAKEDQEKEPTEHDVRKNNLKQLHDKMDEQVANRKCRLLQAQEAKDTTRQWDLIAAATEEAVIDYHQRQSKEASRMRGRSKITFKNKEKNFLNDIN